MFYEMAENDEALFDRLLDLSYDELLAYVQSLPESERQPMAQVILRAASLRSLANLKEDLHQGLKH